MCPGLGGQSLCALLCDQLCPLLPPLRFPGPQILWGFQSFPLPPPPDPVHLSVCGRGQAGGCPGRGDVKLRTGEPDRKVTGASRESWCPELTLGVALEGQLGGLGWGVRELPGCLNFLKWERHSRGHAGLLRNGGHGEISGSLGAEGLTQSCSFWGGGRDGWVTLNSGERQAGLAEDLISQDALGSAPRNFLLEVP